MSNLFKKRKTNHIGHLILSILFFPWAIVWILIHLNNSNYNDRVDERLYDRDRRRDR